MTMTRLENIINDIEAYKDSRFKWNRDGQKLVADLVDALCFQGELDGDAFYLALCINFVNKKTGELRFLSEQEANEFYTTKTISGLDCGWVPCQWVSIYFQLKKRFLRVMETEELLVDRTPKENFAVAFTQNRDFLGRVNGGLYKVAPPPGDFIRKKHDVVLESFDHQATFERLAKLIDWAKTHRIDEPNFYDKILIPLTEYFDDPLRAIRDDQYSETDVRKTLSMPSYFERMSIPASVRSILNGPSYEDLFFSETIELHPELSALGDVYKSAENVGLDFLWSVVTLINDGKTTKSSPVETTLERVSLSNDWKDGEENVALFRIAKVKGQTIFELEVRQSGIVYLIHRSQKAVEKAMEENGDR